MRFFSKMRNSFINKKQELEMMRYKKYISNFSSPHKQDNVFELSIDGLTEFDLVSYSDDNSIDGVLSKRFVMLDSVYFLDFFNSANDQSFYYQTYLEEDDVVNGVVPQKLSVLLKKQSRKGIGLEVFASKVMNFFGANTVYNECVSDAKGINYFASIDFIKKDENFYTLDDLCEDELFSKHDRLLNIQTAFKQFLKIIAKQNSLHLGLRQQKNLLDELIYSVAVRRLVCSDGDVRSGNFGVLINKKKKTLRLGPAFDYGCSFLFETDMSFLKTLAQINRPMYDKFVERFEMFVAFDKQKNKHYYELMIEKYVDNSDCEYQITRLLNKNIENIKKTIIEIENQKQSSK